MELNGWTKVGDQIGGTGKWVVYRHRAVVLASLEVVEEMPPEDEARALRAYSKRAETVRRGGLWLVDPSGRVRGVTFIRP